MSRFRCIVNFCLQQKEKTQDLQRYWFCFCWFSLNRSLLAVLCLSSSLTCAATNCAPTNHFGSKIIHILPLVSPIKEIDIPTNNSGPADVLVCSGWQSAHKAAGKQYKTCSVFINFLRWTEIWSSKYIPETGDGDEESSRTLLYLV